MIDIVKIKEAAREELYNISYHATDEQWRKLTTNISFLLSSSPYQCVYGLMTGVCWSAEADELIAKCATPYMCFSNIKYYAHHQDSCVLTTERMITTPSDYPDERYYTPVEVVLYEDKNLVRLWILEFNGIRQQR